MATGANIKSWRKRRNLRENQAFLRQTRQSLAEILRYPFRFEMDFKKFMQTVESSQQLEQQRKVWLDVMIRRHAGFLQLLENFLSFVRVQKEKKAKRQKTQAYFEDMEELEGEEQRIKNLTEHLEESIKATYRDSRRLEQLLIQLQKLTTEYDAAVIRYEAALGRYQELDNAWQLERQELAQLKKVLVKETQALKNLESAFDASVKMVLSKHVPEARVEDILVDIRALFQQPELRKLTAAEEKALENAGILKPTHMQKALAIALSNQGALTPEALIELNNTPEVKAYAEQATVVQKVTTSIANQEEKVNELEKRKEDSKQEVTQAKNACIALTSQITEARAVIADVIESQKMTQSMQVTKELNNVNKEVSQKAFQVYVPTLEKEFQLSSVQIEKMRAVYEQSPAMTLKTSSEELVAGNKAVVETTPEFQALYMACMSLPQVSAKAQIIAETLIKVGNAPAKAEEAVTEKVESKVSAGLVDKQNEQKSGTKSRKFD